MTPKKILIVDDDQHLLIGLTARLKHHGYSVVTSMDAVSAIAVAKRSAPDLIILDLGLPAGDGYLVLERLKELPDLAMIPVIVLSARDPVPNKQRSMEAGAVAFFQKPPENHALMAAIHHALGETTALSAFLTT
ncbi:response regulator [Silvibacterium sp.]|uniref:response regulator n=1 Tax=Silvibacterium sp. TaxID=1964179 RepID=UPI0039E6245E